TWSQRAVLAYLVVAVADGRRGLAEAVAAGARVAPLVLGFAILEAALMLPSLLWARHGLHDVPRVQTATRMFIGSLITAVAAQALLGLIILAIPATIERRLSAVRGIGAGLALAWSRRGWMAITLLVLFGCSLMFSMLPMLLVPLEQSDAMPTVYAMAWIRFAVAIPVSAALGLFWAAVYQEVRRRSVGQVQGPTW
ncbi:MAG TPA: hypothetical protein VEA44_09110, partial [Caulobacter sp.]|nr:hypothetical protein [Caulobacter sp.]